jgi:hypothetical protein
VKTRFFSEIFQKNRREPIFFVKFPENFCQGRNFLKFFTKNRVKTRFFLKFSEKNQAKPIFSENFREKFSQGENFYHFLPERAKNLKKIRKKGKNLGPKGKGGGKNLAQEGKRGAAAGGRAPFFLDDERQRVVRRT